MTSTTAAELDLSAGTYVKGIVLNAATFMAVSPFQQLRVITRDPDVLQMNSKRGADDPDIVGEREIHTLIQRALAGSKKTNVPVYQQYIQHVVTGAKPGVLPPMHLWTEQELAVVEPGSTVYLLVPNGEHLLAIDGETQLAAHHALGRAEAVDTATKAKHRQWPLSAVIHHGISTTTARQYFYDLNVLSVRPNASLSLGMNTQDPIMGIVDDVTAASEVLSTRVERQARQLPRKSEKVVTLTNLRQMVITIAKGISGIQYGARPMPTEGVDLAELRAVATAWIPQYFAAFPLEIRDRDASLAGSGPVLAAVGALGQRLLTTTAEDRSGVRQELLDDLRAVDWSKGPHWNGVAGGYTASGVFSVKGTKEVAYAVHNALSDPRSPAYAQVRGGTPPASESAPTASDEAGDGSAAGTKKRTVADEHDGPAGIDLEQLASLPWDDESKNG